jgi:integrase
VSAHSGRASTVVVTGVRRGELCGLQIRDVDLDRFP